MSDQPTHGNLRQRLEELLDRATRHVITRDEIDEAALLLRGPIPGVNLYAVLQTVGWGMGTWHEDDIARFLDWPQDSQVAAKALQVLVVFWGDPERRYRDWVAAALDGLPWDDQDEVRLSAVFAARVYCERDDDVRLAQALVRIALGDDNPLFRETAGASLALALAPDRRDVGDLAVRRNNPDTWVRGVVDDALHRWREPI